MKLTTELMIKKGFELHPWGWVRNNPDAPLVRFSSSPKDVFWVEMGNGFIIKLETVEKLELLLSLCGLAVNKDVKWSIEDLEDLISKIS